MCGIFGGKHIVAPLSKQFLNEQCGREVILDNDYTDGSQPGPFIRLGHSLISPCTPGTATLVCSATCAKEGVNFSRQRVAQSRFVGLSTTRNWITFIMRQAW